MPMLEETYILLGQRLTIAELSHVAGIPQCVLKRRLCKGCSPEEAIRRPSRGNRVMIGQAYGDFTVESCAGVDINRKRRWNCVCKCGKRRRIHESDLKDGLRVDCGCERRAKEAKKHRLKWVDHTNHPIGTHGGIVLGFTGQIVKIRGHRDYVWLCRCACGKRFELTARVIRSGNREWCGNDCKIRRQLVGAEFRARAPRLPVGDKMLSFSEAAAICGVSANCLRFRMKRHNCSLERAMAMGDARGTNSTPPTQVPSVRSISSAGVY